MFYFRGWGGSSTMVRMLSVLVMVVLLVSPHGFSKKCSEWGWDDNGDCTDEVEDKVVC